MINFETLIKKSIMKKLVFPFLALALFSCNETKIPKTNVIFGGNIQNPNGDKFKISSSEKVVGEFEVNKDGSFKDTINEIESGYYYIRYNNETSPIYLEPGFDMDLKLNPEEFDESIVYSGTGALENNYLAQKALNKEALGKLDSYQYLGTLEEKDYVTKMDSIKNVELQFLEHSNITNESFKALEKANITYDWVNKMRRFEPYKRFVTKNPDFKKSTAFPDVLSQVELENESLIGVQQYKNFLSNYYSEKSTAQAKKDSIAQDVAYLKMVAQEVQSPKIKEYLLYNAAKYGVTYTKELQNYYDIFMANTTNVAHKKEITEKYEKLLKLSKGATSPKFDNYENYAGGTSSLDDFKGKYVYIDVWATWCGPCLREVPALKEVEAKYHDKNIVFVSMSIDKAKDHEKWKTMIAEKELKGVQLFAPKDWSSDFVTAYGILGIPRFIMIDPEGNIVDANAPRPSSKELITLLESLNI